MSLVGPAQLFPQRGIVDEPEKISHEPGPVFLCADEGAACGRQNGSHVADIDGRNERRLTDVHREFLAEVEVASRPSERVLYTSYDGTPVEGFLLYPYGYDEAAGSYPLIVVNHGGPHSASGYGFSFKNMLFAANGYFVFLPNFRSSTGYGEDFLWATWGAWGDKDGEDVMSGVDYVLANYPADGTRVATRFGQFPSVGTKGVGLRVALPPGRPELLTVDH